VRVRVIIVTLLLESGVSRKRNKLTRVLQRLHSFFRRGYLTQNEIEEIASSPAAQLELLDRFQEPEAAAIAREMEQLQRQLDQSSVDLRRIDQEVDDLRGKASELPVLQERLKGFAEIEGPGAAKINAAHTAKSARAREEKLPELLIAALQRVARDIA